MSSVWIALLALAVPPVEQGTRFVDEVSSASVSQQAAPRSGWPLKTAIHDAFRRWANPSDADAPAAAREYLSLFEELKQDQKLSEGQHKYLAAKMRGRMVKLAAQIKKQQAKQKRPESVDAAAHTQILAQRRAGWGGFGGMMPAGVGAMGPGMAMGGFGAMGPGMGMGFGGGANRMPTDAGQDLVDLIQTTISPPTWDVNGGPGSIKYWAPGHSIVVSAPGHVHHDLGNLIDQLNRAMR